MNKLRTMWLGALCAPLWACAGQSVEPLDPKDLSLPVETRQWIADAEDAVIAAEARVASREAKLDEVQAWRSDMEDQVDFDSGGGVDMDEALDGLMDARVQLHEAKLAQAEAGLRIAVVKRRLANAERANLHDLANYDLDVIREDVDDAVGEAQKATRTVSRRRKDLAAATDAWWDAYARYARAGGRTADYWIGAADPLPVE